MFAPCMYIKMYKKYVYKRGWFYSQKLQTHSYEAFFLICIFIIWFKYFILFNYYENEKLFHYLALRSKLYNLSCCRFLFPVFIARFSCSPPDNTHCCVSHKYEPHLGTTNDATFCQRRIIYKQIYFNGQSFEINAVNQKGKKTAMPKPYEIMNFT